MTEKFITQSIECFRANVPLEKDTILNLIHAAQDSFWSQPTLIEIDPGEGEKVTICGDIHGDFTANLPCSLLTRRKGNYSNCWKSSD
jgi:hypothetical protein